MTKSERILIRLTPAQHKVLSEAAAAQGMDLSAWARSVLIIAARKIVRESNIEAMDAELRQRAVGEITT